MRDVHHYERINKGASQTCHTKQIAYFLQKLSVSKNEPLTNQWLSGFKLDKCFSKWADRPLEGDFDGHGGEKIRRGR